MTVKAESRVSLYDHTDTIKVIPWYYKQLRTVTTPPTIAQGDMSPSGWTTTEPTITSTTDLQYKVYIAHQNIYGDNTCWWGYVSVYSTFEAAVQSYNKALAAEGTADLALKQSVWYATCDTKGDVEEKEATITPSTSEFKLKAGATVNVKFANNNTASPGAIRLNVNAKGAKPIRYILNKSTTTIPDPGYIASKTYQFVYDGSYWLLSNFNYNTNTHNMVQISTNIKAADSIVSNRLICGTESGYKNVDSGTVFDLSYPLLYTSNSIVQGGTSTNSYLKISVIVSNNGTIENPEKYKTLYLKGTVDSNTFTIAETPFMTTVVPSEEDGFCYIPLGMMYSDSSIYFDSSSDLYAFKDGKFGPVSLREAAAAAKTATNYITKIDETNGISVHDVDDNKNFVNINADDGVTIYRDISGTATDVANFGESVRIGQEISQQVNLDGKKLLFKSDANTPTMLLTPPSLQSFSATSIKEVAVSKALAEGELVAVISPPSNATLTDLGSVQFRILSGAYNVDVAISDYDNKPTFSSSNRSTWFYYYTDDEQQYVYIEANGTWTPTSGTYRFSASCFFTKEVNLMAIGCHPYFKNDSNLHAKYKYAFVVGTGRSDVMPENALEVRNDGRTLISASQELLAAISSLGWEDDCLVDELTESSTFYTLNGLINSL